MSKETEKLFKELQKIMDEHPFESNEAAEGAIMQYISTSSAATDDEEPDAYDYLEKAQYASTSASAIKYAKKALELEPDMAEAKLLIIMHQRKDLGSTQHEIEALLEEEQAHLAQQDITEEKCAGDYYQIFETRPYLRIYKTYIDVLVEQGKIRKAADMCRKVCSLNESDNLGVRYMLIALYAFLEERELAEELYKKYREDITSYMLLPMTALYYKLDDTRAAENCLQSMCAKNKSVKRAIKTLKKGDEEELMDIISASYYSPFSAEELVMAFTDSIFLYEPMAHFLQWMEEHIPSKGGSVAKSGTRGKKK